MSLVTIIEIGCTKHREVCCCSYFSGFKHLLSGKTLSSEGLTVIYKEEEEKKSKVHLSVLFHL